MEVHALGLCTGIVATLPVPLDWPEQQVRTVEERATPNVRPLRYRTLAGGVRQLLITIPRLDAGETASVTVVLEITRTPIIAPIRTDDLRDDR